MRIRIFALTALAGLFLLCVCACSRTGDSAVEYVPFQETDDGQWGMVSMDGKVLFTDEFKTQPTVVRDGRFFVRTKEGMWEMYTATEKPKKVGADYAHASGFRGGVALVAEKGKPVSIIDTEGKTVKLLDKIAGKTVDGVRAFSGGYAVFMTTDSLYGAINMKGDCVVEPQYCWLNDCSDSKFVGVNSKYRDAVNKGRKDKVKVSVLDDGGKALFELSAAKYEDIRSQFVDGLLPVSVKKDAKEVWGLINDKGEMIVQPSSKIKAIGNVSGDKFTYSNGDGWGLMDVKGNTLIRAKYDFLYYDSDGLLVAGTKDGDAYAYKYVSEKDEPVTEDTYVSATPYSLFDGKHAVVQPNDKTYSIIDRKGRQVEGLPDMVNVGYSDGDSYVMSDYVDLQKLVAALNITPKGVLGVTTASTPQQVVQMSVKLGTASGTEANPAGSAYWYDYRDAVDLYKDAEGVRADVRVRFSGNLSHQSYRTKRVIDYTFYDYYWYHDEKIPTGYVWNEVSPNQFMVSISNAGKMRGKLRDLYGLLSAKFKKMGATFKENNSAVVVDLKEAGRALVFMQKDNVSAVWGINMPPAKDIDIDRYKDASEEYDSDDASSSDESDSSSYDGYDSDSVAADSVIADSAATF